MASLRVIGTNRTSPLSRRFTTTGSKFPRSIRYNDYACCCVLVSRLERGMIMREWNRFEKDFEKGFLFYLCPLGEEMDSFMMMGERYVASFRVIGKDKTLLFYNNVNTFFLYRGNIEFNFEIEFICYICLLIWIFIISIDQLFFHLNMFFIMYIIS